MESVAIIIPNYNDNATLRAAIESVLQEDADLEIHVIDDCSKEDPYPLIKDLPINYHRFNENRGLSAARNYGISMSNSKWILPLDADDTLFKGALKPLIEAPGDIKYGNMMIGQTTLIPNKNITYIDFTKNNQIYTTSLFSKGVWEHIGGYWEERVYEDWDFWGRAAKAGFIFTYVGVDVYKHTQKNNGLCAQLDKDTTIRQKVIEHICHNENRCSNNLL